MFNQPQTQYKVYYYGNLMLVIRNVIGLILEWIIFKMLYQQNKDNFIINDKYKTKKAKKDNVFKVLYNGWSV